MLAEMKGPDFVMKVVLGFPEKNLAIENLEK